MIDRAMYPLWRVWVVLPLAAVWLAACEESQRLNDAELAAESLGEPMFSDELLLAATKVALPPAGLVAEELPDPHTSGAEYTQKYCTACHELPSPLIHSATDWPRVLRRMWLRMERVSPSFNVPVPTSAERLVIQRYAIDNALRVSGASLPAAPGRSFFSATCSRCHDLPDPRQHSPEDWVAVVRRMMDRMDQMLGETLDQNEYARVVEYLRRVSTRAS